MTIYQVKRKEFSTTGQILRGAAVGILTSVPLLFLFHWESAAQTKIGPYVSAVIVFIATILVHLASRFFHWPRKILSAEVLDSPVFARLMISIFFVLLLVLFGLAVLFVYAQQSGAQTKREWYAMAQSLLFILILFTGGILADIDFRRKKRID